jgi:hypothetical protein
MVEHLQLPTPKEGKEIESAWTERKHFETIKSHSTI